MTTSKGLACAGERHDTCIDRAMTAAERLCRERGLRLTPLRRQVLELIWGSHRPIGAYALLEKLRERWGRTAPPTVYRALEFLQGQGLVHRLASLNAFAGCARPGQPHAGQFLICASCQNLTEIDDPQLHGAIADSAGAAGFTVQHPTVELLGLCAACRKEGEI
ncbi:zinc uptake transcriptional repressor Zur [Desulfuromonas carbonis]|uniref:Fur family transcriptional regulator n=1 Tax=Desulfuromonas sp. DDH964 TaxID=1823759 RepID=UPI00078D328D|nr:Fur family transcriptional regulator [Desulfuromonas sp. DDH964]AMV70950.1 Fur family transcriptional regulator [Desulfuromonas sp. DDH964]